MANIFPQQQRNIDPFSNYNSNIVSRLTRMITRGNDSLHSPHALDVIIDSIAPTDHLVVTAGELFKDDILIIVDTDFTVDMTESDFYVSGTPFNEAGYYWIVANYEYVKSIPPPQMSIKIIKPTDHSSFESTKHVFLKSVRVLFSGSFYIDSVHDIDPLEPTIGKRTYTQIYPGLENSIPSTFDPNTDEGRFIYVRDKASLYFGTQTEFEAVDSVRDIIDTTNCELGDICYVGPDGVVYPAQADSVSTLGQAVVISVGLESNGTGKIKTSGRVDGVPLESGITPTVGESMYLSLTEAGTVTNIGAVTPSIKQYLGACIAINGTTVSMWYTPTSLAATGGIGTSGYSGISGISGAIGTSGYSGISGATGGNYTFTQSTGASVWVATHNLNKQPVLATVYDINYNQIMPYNLLCNTVNQCTVTFLTNVSGYAIFG